MLYLSNDVQNMVSLSTTKPMSVIGIALDFILPPPTSMTYLASQPDSQSPPPPSTVPYSESTSFEPDSSSSPKVDRTNRIEETDRKKVDNRKDYGLQSRIESSQDDISKGGLVKDAPTISRTWRKSLLFKAQQREKDGINLGRQNTIKGVLGAKKSLSRVQKW